MKVAHVNYRPSAGVYSKILGQAKAARDQNLDMDFIVVSDEDYPVNENVRLIKLDWPKNPIVKHIAKRFLQFRMIIRSVDLDDYDRIILRYPGSFDPFYKKFFTRYPNKIITEHHSLLVDELKILGRGFLNPLRMFLERRNFPKVLSKTIGVIGVTEEICERIISLTERPLQFSVVSNGVDGDTFRSSQFNPFDGATLYLLFVSNTFYPAQGLDRLLSWLMRYQGKVMIDLKIVGNIYRKSELESIKHWKNENVKLHVIASLTGKEYDDCFNNVNIGVSTIALNRKKLSEACPLKTREYLARGIPVVYAYKDVDIEDDFPFVLRLNDDDSPIDMNQLFHFAENLSRRENASGLMKDFILNKLDWKIKIKKCMTS